MSDPATVAHGRRTFLLGFDLEDVRSMIEGGERYRAAVPRTTRLFLDLLARHSLQATFFTVGDVARRYPDLIGEIARQGHELACHSSDHEPLDRQTPASLAADIERNRDDLMRAGAPAPVGFRAPIFSLTPGTQWAYEVLADAGFLYSSSVLPRRSPLYGWESFGEQPVRVGGVWEVPVSTDGVAGFGVPFAGGVYFRLLPLLAVRPWFRRRQRRGAPVVGYLHPYDLDLEQERFQHPGLGGNGLANALMYLNRARVLPRLERLITEGWRISTYERFVREHLGTNP